MANILKSCDYFLTLTKHADLQENFAKRLFLNALEKLPEFGNYDSLTLYRELIPGAKEILYFGTLASVQAANAAKVQIEGFEQARKSLFKKPKSENEKVDNLLLSINVFWTTNDFSKEDVNPGVWVKVISVLLEISTLLNFYENGINDDEKGLKLLKILQDYLNVVDEIAHTSVEFESHMTLQEKGMTWSLMKEKPNKLKDIKNKDPRFVIEQTKGHFDKESPLGQLFLDKQEEP